VVAGTYGAGGGRLEPGGGPPHGGPPVPGGPSAHSKQKQKFTKSMDFQRAIMYGFFYICTCAIVKHYFFYSKKFLLCVIGYDIIQEYHLWQ